jgi:hypothetical protein
MYWLLVSMFAASLQTPSDGCRLLDRDHPPLYLTYERFGDTPDDKGGVRHVVWLRFHNNTSCAVRLFAVGPHRSLTEVPPDGAEWQVDYSVFRKDRLVKFCYAACSDWDLIPVDELAPGNTAVFQVLQRHFLVGERIAVSYSYAWEWPFGLYIGPTKSSTRFDDANEIPLADRRRFRK